MDQTGYFDRVAIEYDSLYLDPVSEAENQIVVDLITRFQRNGQSVLDLGCGTGLMLERGPDYAPDLKQYTGLDISEQMLIALKQKDNSKISKRLFLGDINRFTEFLEPGEKFDICLSTFGSFSYVDDLLGALADVKNVLSSNGVALLMFYSQMANSQFRKRPKASLERFLGKYTFRNDTKDLGHLAYFYSERSILDTLEKVGITSYEIFGLNHRSDSEYSQMSSLEVQDVLKQDMVSEPVDKAHSIVLIFGNYE